MAAKRTASNELTHDNWDDDYEPEEAGTFKRASEDVIKNRVIKTARRRNPISASNSDSPKNVFSGFDGFKKPNTESQSKTNSPFAFASLMTTTTTTTTTKSDSPTSTNTFGLFKNIASSTNVSTGSAIGSPFKIPDVPSASNLSTSKEKSDANDNNTSYYAKLKGLNESVLDWIKSHMETNPFIILSPVFADYDKHLKEIEKENVTKNNNKSLLSSPAKSSAHSASIFGNLSNKSSDSNFLSSSSTDKPKDTLSEFSTPEASTTSFSFGSKNSTSTTGFSFGAGKPFTFTNVSRPETPETSTPAPEIKEAQQQQEDEDEPPKVEFTPVVEDGSIFQKRCKVFVKKDGQYSDRGVGQLFLKPVEGSEKIQLIVRADTSLGNLLLNFILNSSVPLQRMGKNNVMLVSIPTPECKPPPIPILLRVKTAEEADDLLKVLQKYSK